MTALTPITLTPDQIRIEANIRRDVKVDKPFWSSIKQDGVLIPIVVEHVDGAYRVIDGQRRTLAAIDGGVTEIPAFVVDTIKGDADRVIRQLVVNDHREPITDADRLAAWQTLFDLDVSADAIARKTKAPKAKVEAAKKVSADPTLTAIVVEQQIPLDVMAEIAEFADQPDLVEQLVEQYKRWPAGFPHEIARVRDRIASDKARAAAREQVAAAGYTLLDQAPTWSDENAGRYVRIDEVYTDEQLTQHAFDGVAELKDIPPTTPGLVVHVYRDHSIRDEIAFAATGYIENPLEHGFHVHVTATTPTTAEPVDDEAAKEERRRVLANNKTWPIATEVRRTWISHLLQRKTLPADVDMFVANSIVRQHVWQYGDEHLNIARDLLQITGPDDWSSPRETLAVHLTAHTAPRIVLAAAIARTEGELTAKDAWRSNSPAGLARYLTALAAWGYGLSELEQQIVDANPEATK